MMKEPVHVGQHGSAVASNDFTWRFKRAKERGFDPKPYQGLFRAETQAALLLADCQGRVLLANEAACMALGWTRNIRWRNLAVDFLPRERGLLTQAMQNAPSQVRLLLRGGKSISVQFGLVAENVVLCTFSNEQLLLLLKNETEAYAHDIKTELACAAGTVQILALDSGDMPDFSQKLTRIRRFCEHASSMAEQLCSAYRLAELCQEEPDQVLWMKSLLQELCKDLQALANSRGIDLAFSCESEELRFVGQGKGLRRLMINLITNAIKFTPEQGRIHVKAQGIYWAGKNYTEILVRDTGKGMDITTLPSARQRYAKRVGVAGEGQGVGLSIVREMVNSLGGRMRLRSQPGKGTEISLRFPVEG